MYVWQLDISYENKQDHVINIKQGFGRVSLIGSLPLADENTLRLVTADYQLIHDDDTYITYEIIINTNGGRSISIKMSVTWRCGVTLCRYLNDKNVFWTIRICTWWQRWETLSSQKQTLSNDEQHKQFRKDSNLRRKPWWSMHSQCEGVLSGLSKTKLFHGNDRLPR